MLKGRLLMPLSATMRYRPGAVTAEKSPIHTKLCSEPSTSVIIICDGSNVAGTATPDTSSTTVNAVNGLGDVKRLRAYGPYPSCEAAKYSNWTKSGAVAARIRRAGYPRTNRGSARRLCFRGRWSEDDERSATKAPTAPTPRNAKAATASPRYLTLLLALMYPSTTRTCVLRSTDLEPTASHP